MKSFATAEFWTGFAILPPEIQRRRGPCMLCGSTNPKHPSLRFKKVGDVWSVRIGSGYRALALLEKDAYYWFWIGTHDEYEEMLAQ